MFILQGVAMSVTLAEAGSELESRPVEAFELNTLDAASAVFQH